MKKILLITKFFPPEIGGIQNYLYNLILNLPKEKIVIITDLLKKESLKNNLDKINFPFKVYRLNFQTLKSFHLSTFSLFFRICKIIKKEKINYLLCGHLQIAGFLAFLFKKLYKIPYSIFTHGLDIFSIKKSNFIKRKIFILTMQEAKKIIVTTDFMENYLKNEFKISAEKIVKIPPGINIEKFSINKENLNLLIKNLKIENQKIILTCGRLVKRKNHLAIIHALSQIIKEIPNVQYFIVGNGPEEKNLQNEVKKLKLENYVKFFSKISDKDLPYFYHLAKIFVMPSTEIKEKGDIEGFGIVFLEAAACGIPCIGGKSGGQREAIVDKKTGFLVNPENTNEIAKTIIKLLKFPNLAKKMGEEGKKLVINNFNCKIAVEKLKKFVL